MDSEPTRREVRYVLGSDPHELTRLDCQAATIEAATRLLLKASGIGPGMRVLDLGTGLGHVARLAGQRSVPTGPSSDSIGPSRCSRRHASGLRAAGERHVSFVEGDVGRWRADEPFDAIRPPPAVPPPGSGGGGSSSAAKPCGWRPVRRH